MASSVAVAASWRGRRAVVDLRGVRSARTLRAQADTTYGTTMRVPRIVNMVVATMCTDPLALTCLAGVTAGKCEASRFPAYVWKMFAKFAQCMNECDFDPWLRVTLLIYPTGTVTCTGVTSDRKKDLFYTIFLHWIMRAHHDRARRAGPVVALPVSAPWMPYPCTYNKVYSSTLRGGRDDNPNVSLCLAEFYKSNPMLKRYDPNVFPGMPIIVPFSNMTAVVHDSGKVHIANAPSLAAALWFVSVIAEEAAPFFVDHREGDSRTRNVQRLDEYSAIIRGMSYKAVPQHIQDRLLLLRDTGAADAAMIAANIEIAAAVAAVEARDEAVAAAAVAVVEARDKAVAAPLRPLAVDGYASASASASASTDSRSAHTKLREEEEVARIRNTGCDVRDSDSASFDSGESGRAPTRRYLHELRKRGRKWKRTRARGETAARDSLVNMYSEPMSSSQSSGAAAQDRATARKRKRTRAQRAQRACTADAHSASMSSESFEATLAKRTRRDASDVGGSTGRKELRRWRGSVREGGVPSVPVGVDMAGETL
jgi:TATA-box binding protein (TBP) (component of TFIID and TFIIIB)